MIQHPYERKGSGRQAYRIFSQTPFAMSIKHSIGIDIAKADFKACFLEFRTIDQRDRQKAAKTFANTPSGIESFAAWAEKHRSGDIPCCTVMEATGNYHEQLACHLQEQGHTVHVVLANRSKAFMKSIGQKTKNDHVDAKALALMGVYQKLDSWQPLSKHYYRLRALTRHVAALQKAKTVMTNQSHAIDQGMYGVEEVAGSLGYLTKELDNKINEAKQKAVILLMEDPEAAERAECAASIKGVGLYTVALIVAETNGFALIKNHKQLTSYAGYDVRENQSGSRKGRTSISKRGNAHIRGALYLPSANTARFKVRPFQDLRERMLEKGCTPLAANTAVQSKLLRFIYTLWTKKEKFNPEHGKEKDDNTGQQEVAASSSPDAPQAKNEGKAEGKKPVGKKQKTVAPQGTTALDDTPSEQSEEHLLLLKQT